ncbi:MAG: winged helix DNA-binding domain-containing protein [Actinomycetota bacterium]|nr:winged helix DNA-binding domain-containing protein [Actinomycetota bacterium]
MRRLRLAAQRLSPGAQAASAHEAAVAVCGVQAQDVRAGGLALRSRVPHLERADVDAAPLVRTWTVRGTVHLIAEEDRAWLHAVCAPRYGPRFEAMLAKRGGLKIARGMLDDIVDLLCEPRGRASLLAELASRGHPELDPGAVNVLVPWASQLGVVLGLADGRLRASDPPPPMDLDEALATMARRYLAGYGPAGAEDLAYWSGQPLSVARRALDAAGPLDPPAEPPPEPALKLLAAFDTTMLGHRSRGWVVPAEHDRRVLPGGGMLRPVVLSRGLGAGTWRYGARGLEVDWFGRPVGSRALSAEAADVARFLGV